MAGAMLIRDLPVPERGARVCKGEARDMRRGRAGNRRRGLPGAAPAGATGAGAARAGSRATAFSPALTCLACLAGHSGR
jgi:hypothetical protein